MDNRYMMTTAYSDCSVKSEHGNDFMSLLRAAAIYWEDPDCEYIHIWDKESGRDMLSFSRPH